MLPSLDYNKLYLRFDNYARQGVPGCFAGVLASGGWRHLPHRAFSLDPLAVYGGLSLWTAPLPAALLSSVRLPPPSLPHAVPTRDRDLELGSEMGLVGSPVAMIIFLWKAIFSLHVHMCHQGRVDEIGPCPLRDTAGVVRLRCVLAPRATVAPLVDS